MSDSEAEEYQFYGTAIEDEQETRAGQHRKDVRDAAATRALPLHQQEVTDEQGRRRFHGAFTGGYSAGYFNTVGSKEGWQPSVFRSSREARAGVQQSVEQFLDEDELEELRRTNLQTTQEYDTFGSTAAELARRAAAEAASERPSAIPGLMPEEMVAPVADSVGVRLLQKMGWRQGKGIGVGGDAPTADDEEAEEGGAAAAGAAGAARRRRWGRHVTVAADNTALYLLAPKTDVHGLGFDPFKGAEDFRRLKEEAQAKARAGTAASEAGKKRRRGIAFGSGVLDEDDAYGTLEDYVTHDDVDSYEGTIEASGLPRSKGPVVQKSGLGDRLASKGYSFEIMEEEEEEVPAIGWHSAHPHRQQQYALPGREAPLMLQSREQQVKSSLVAGFVRATATITVTFFPPPRVPPGYVPVHHPSGDGEAALPAASSKFAPAQAEPPGNPELRQAIDSLAFFVARNGVVFETMARQRQQKEGRWAFLSGGEGAAYYRWKVHSLRSMIQPQRPKRAIGQRSAPLSADERGALLGEQQLAAAAGAGWAAGATAAAPAAPAGEAQQALRRQLLQVAESDRQRLQHLLSRSFVAAESNDVLDASAAAVSGLRPGAPAPPPRPAAGAAGAAGAAAKVVTEADLARPADASGQAGAAGLALRPAAGAAPAAGQQPRLPVRRSEEWRPVALLCKRFNVPDPYQGRPAELQMSRFRTDHLVLPDTAAAVAATLNAVPSGAQDFLLPPSVASALAEAEAKHQLAAAQQGAAAAAAAPALAPQQAQQDAAGAADAFLSSLSDMLGGGGGAAGAGEATAAAAGGELAPPLPSEPPPADQAGAGPDAEAERPVDLFKAIFEDSDEEDEEEEADATAHEQQPQQQLGEPQPSAAQQEQQARRQGGLALVDDDVARPQQAQQAAQQQMYRGREDASFGFAKLRGTPAGPAPPAGSAAAAPAIGAAAAAAAAGIDEAMRQRVQDALRALKGDKKGRKERKDKDKDKDKKRSSRKEEKSKKRKSGSKDKGRRRHKKEGKRRRRRSGSDNDGSSSGSSGSDSD